MIQTDLEAYGIAHLIRDYARSGTKYILTVSDIEEFLFTMGIECSENALFGTLQEMADAGWIRHIDYHNRLVVFSERMRSAA